MQKKGLKDTQQQKEGGPMYSSDAFDIGDPGPTCSKSKLKLD